ncbi:complement factor H [Anomaloglossus baeobatrachus]|uniref:complement factor H n=1 Tax=Anomaloglossus baeobatrachus TaxID=238106 RepID=UPI003F5024FA
MFLLGYVLLLTAAIGCTVAATDGSCERPERMVEAELVGDWESDRYPGGTQAVYQCRPGYTRLGTIKKACINGEWQFFGTKGQCKKKSCGHPGDIPFGSFELKNEETFVFGAVVLYACDEGYRLASKEKSRQCTATGWSNYPPHCEVMNCPPIEGSDNLNVLSTSYDDEYSVGQVVRFECKNPNLKLNGASEIFCMSDGKWNLEPPICTEIKCNRPTVARGTVNHPGKLVFSNNDMIQITCDEGYRPNKNGESSCTKDDWFPKPSCTEITCTPPQIVQGSVDGQKAMYKYGEYINVQCNDGYVLQNEPDKRRKCTINGWEPASTCVSKKCDEPKIINGYIYGWYHRFPKYPGSIIEYRCNQNYLTPQKVYWERIECTKNGWSSEPKCLRRCSSEKAYVENSRNYNIKPIILEGEDVQYTCQSNYHTPDRQSSGIRTCLPDGDFTTAKCSITCKAPRLLNGKYTQSKSEFVNGEYLQYNCNKGYMTQTRNLFATAQCLDGEWSEIPKCIAITCEFSNRIFKDKAVISYTCPRGQRPKSDLVQCFNYGWGPPTICEDIECTIPATLNVILSPHQSSYKTDVRVSFSCNRGFKRVGARISTCTEQGWDPILPTCEKEKPDQPDTTDSPDKEVEMPPAPDSVAPTPDSKDKTDNRERCARAHNPRYAEIRDLKQIYYSNDKVTIECNIGYKMYGSATIQCIDGIWEQPPECYGVKECRSQLSISNGDLTADSRKDKYVTGDVVKYDCNPGFHISGSSEIICVNGQWSGSPECTEDSCIKAPEIDYATVNEEKTYKHSERAEYTCKIGYGFSGGNSAQCVKGKWMNVPTCVVTFCTRPPAVPNSTNSGQNKNKFISGEKVTYSCDALYSLEKSSAGEAKCEKSEWINVPECRKIGDQCGVPPTVQFGDTIGIRKTSYKSNDYVEYKCPNFYLLKGEKIVRCLNGVWGEAPVCLEPCTAKEKNMDDNNIQLRHRSDKKLYSTHGDTLEYACKAGFEAPHNAQMRFTCEHGKLGYAKCFRKGYCVLEQSTMLANNVHYNESTVLDNGQTIRFQCNEEMTPQKGLEATCTSGKLEYPKCTAARGCDAPEILNGRLKTPKDSYDSGDYAEFECNEDYVKNNLKGPKCEKGEWTAQPVCYSPCKVSSKGLTDSNIHLLSSDIDKSYTHGTELEVSCKKGYRRPNQPTFLIQCNNGKFMYLRCFSGTPCRMNQDALDTNSLELDEVHNNEVYYGDEETITFKCKKGFSHPDRQPTGTCSKGELKYPKCIGESSV